jgi:uncharacterized protein (TIGR02466 family)
MNNLQMIYPHPVWSTQVGEFAKTQKQILDLCETLEWSQPGFWKDEVQSTIQHTKNVLEFLPDLKSLLDDEMTKFASELKTQSKPILVESWINKFPPGGYMGVHKHLPCNLSGVIFVTVGKGGEFYFENPYNDYDTCLQKGLYTQRQFYNEADIVISPQEGEIIMFRSGLPHGVKTNTDDKTRISLSFNYNV